MSFAETLLRVAKGSTEVVDVLLENTSGGRSSYGNGLVMRGEPSLRTGLDQALRGGQTKGLAIASSSQNGELLDALARKDSRLTVRRQIAANKNTLPSTKKFLLGKVLSKYDSELLDELSRSMRVCDVVEVIGGTTHRFPVRILGAYVSDRDNALLALSNPDIVDADMLAEAALRRVASGAVPDLSIDEAIASCSLTPEAIARALSQAATPLSVAQAQFIADFLPTRSHPSPMLSKEAALLLAGSSDGEKQAAALAGWSDDKEVVTQALRRPSVDVFETIAGLTSSRIVARRTIDSLVAARNASDAAAVEAAKTAPPYRRILPLADHVTNTLFTRDLVASKQVVGLLQSSTCSESIYWLRGDFPVKPVKGQVSELLANPKWAFTEHRGEPEGVRFDGNLLSGSAAARTCLGLAGKLPWGPELFEHTPGLLSALARRQMNASVSEYVFYRLFGSLGSDRSLWQQATMLAGDFPGTISEFIKTLSAVCDKPLVGPVELSLDELWQPAS